MLFADNVRKEIAKVLNVPVTEHSYDDFLLCFQHDKLHIPQYGTMAEYRDVYGLSREV